MKDDIKEYMKDPDGKLSSTRLFCMWTLKFFFGWTIFSALLLLVLALMLKGNSEATSLTIILAGYFSTISILSLIGAFAPKQLSKIQEVKKLIKTIRTNGNNGK